MCVCEGEISGVVGRQQRPGMMQLVMPQRVKPKTETAPTHLARGLCGCRSHANENDHLSVPSTFPQVEHVHILPAAVGESQGTVGATTLEARPICL